MAEDQTLLEFGEQRGHMPLGIPLNANGFFVLCF
jgi:hypothetical protein